MGSSFECERSKYMVYMGRRRFWRFISLFTLLLMNIPANTQKMALVGLIGIAVVSALIFAFIVRPVEKAKSISIQRDSDIGVLERAIGQWRTEVGGSVEALGVKIPVGATLVGSRDGEVDLCPSLIPMYLVAMPFDFGVTGAHYTSCSDYETGYEILRGEGDMIVVRVAQKK